ncbi:MAG: gamma-glutamyl-gamma-aminobutyrate hydrolase family protein [Planctomycetes bacterium]|nr:gamma-glutamyl-gamma-aminobutyrate hydrolase family protein [Planctomycetota bacterium]MBI3848022.1 gamma-glutamyl-gamma-aminobutyrate hydrolase family protein [Planctomycetota bacterium]
MRRPCIAVTCVTQMKDREGEMRHGVDRDYVQALVAAGGAPILLSPALDEDTLASLLPLLHGIVFTGGGDVEPSRFGERAHPKLGRVEKDRDHFELDLYRAARRREIPILGICRGVQLVNVAAGGTLVQDIPSQVARSLRHDAGPREPDPIHDVILEPGSMVRALAGKSRIPVNSFHHQSVKDVAPGFRITATAPDGVVEAIETLDEPFCVGVQWHPERHTRGTIDGFREAIFEVFVQGAAERAKRARLSRSSKRAATLSGRR